MPGIFYRRPAPDQPSFKAEGDDVKSGETVGMIEVMKTFYPVVAAESGKIIRFVVKDNDEVVAGQPIAELVA